MAESNARRNPYIIGLPIDDQKRFFGRKDLFQFIEDNLNQNVKVILLHGQRRIGKSSVLSQIPKYVFKDGVGRDDFVFVPFDLQHQSQLPIDRILHNLAQEIVDHLQLDSDRVIPPLNTDLETDPDIFSRNFLPTVYQALGGKNLVLLLDEFDVLNNDNTDIVDKGLGFFPYLQSLIGKQDKLFIIPVVGRNLNDMPKLVALFKSAPTEEIGYLQEVSAKQLITKPAEGILTYEPEAIRAILELSARHPYFTQVICFTLFGQARDKDDWTVSCEDVERIVDQAIENAEGGLAWFWDGLPIQKKVVFSAVAEAHNIALKNAHLVPEEPLTLLSNYGVLQTEPLIQATKELAEKGFLDDIERRVKVELVRRWLVQRHPLRQEIWELEKLEQQQVNRLSEEAMRLRQQGNNKEALAICEQVLALNPNHFSTLFALAEGYLDAEDFDKAVELYTRAYQVDPIRNKEGLLRTLLSYGHELIKQRKFTLAKQQYDRALEIQPDNGLVKKRLLEITWECQGYRDTPHTPIIVERNQICPNCRRAPNSSEYSSQYRRKRILLGTMAVVGISVIGSVGVSLWSTPCLVGEKKVLGIKCVADQSKIQSNISRGERTLFGKRTLFGEGTLFGELTLLFFNSNSQRDHGIEAFRKKNYPQASAFFGRAVHDAPTDPEVLIYYNNALARRRGSPFTLAVVVPVDKDKDSGSDREMLQGVAQAQNQFNSKGGLNSQFLEIAIANDGIANASNKQAKAEKAQQVAQELVKDPSVLGVIGHDTSESSLAALPVYEKAGLAMISPTSTSTLLKGQVFFRTVPSDASAGKKLAKYTKNSLRLDKVVIFYNPADLYSNSLREQFMHNFQRLGGKVGQLIDLTNPNADKEVASSLRDKAQAALLLPNLEDREKVLPIAKANAKLPQGQRLKLLGGDALYTLKRKIDDVEGLVLAVPWFAKSSQQSQDFSKAAELLQKKGELISWRTATSFDATQAFIEALSPNPTRSKVLQGLRHVNLDPSKTSGEAFSKTSGEALKFTSEGESRSEPILIQVVGGKFTEVK